MPINKNANIRYQALDRCFQNSGRHYSINDLVEACNQALQNYNGKTSSVKKRQVYDDIKFMKSEAGYAIPLQKYKIDRKTYYKYEDRKFSINNQPVNEAEANQIKATLSVFQRFKGLPQFEWLQEMIPKMQQVFGFKQESTTIFQFEQNPHVKGIKLIEPLYQYIIKEQVLKVTFKNFDTPTIALTLHPYLLKQYNKRWFLISWNEKKHKIWITALDRIEAIEVLQDAIYLSNTTDLEDYFDDVLGVTKYQNEVVQKIRLKIYKKSIGYVLTKPLHHSQRKIEQTEDYLIIELCLRRNYELESLILSYGDNIEVIEPQSFRAKIAERIRKMNHFYN